MCYFLTVSVPSKTAPNVPERYRRTIHFSKQTNPSITKMLPHEWVSFTVTAGGCSCDLYCGEPSKVEEESRIVERYRRKGWSQTKIKRAMESRKAAELEKVGLRDDIVDILRELTGGFGQIRISLHWYSGNVDTEVFELNDVGKFYLSDFACDTAKLREEQTVLVKQGGSGTAATRRQT